MEPPYWYYPVRQSLGAALLQAGKVDEAVAQFKAALDKAQGSPFALYGLVQAARAKGDTAAAQAAEEKLKAGWRGDPAFLSPGPSVAVGFKSPHPLRG